ncbi:MAG: acetate--CoA ligase [Candidatus Lokiarchaeota archaeon]|nr:acetate--CoA ligase [Candidatus Lokiarchaeota archaeon]
MDSILKETRIFNPIPEFMKTGHVTSIEQYKTMHKESIENPEKFWGEVAETLDWFKKWDKVWESTDTFPGKWFSGGKLNVSYNCIDRHIKNGRGDQVAIIWEGDDGIEKKFTFMELLKQVSKVANAMKAAGLKKGDRIAIWLPMVPELAIIMLACTRIGVIHSIVFGGFSKEAVKDRIADSEAKLLFTVDKTKRSGKLYPMKEGAALIIDQCPTIEKVIVVKRAGVEVPWDDEKDIWYDDFIANQSEECPCEEMDSEDPMFILYTSGTTGKPKGVLHTTAGYLLFTSYSHKIVFNYKEGEVWFCTADIGWITGHSYIIYGPLCNGATTVMFEGVPTFPDVDRFWAIIEKYKVNQFYTAPTAIRSLMRYGDKPVLKHNINSLKVLGTVGEPINPEAWLWYYRIIGKERCPIVDTYWLTESGGFLITPISTATPMKPGSCTLPFFGISLKIVDIEEVEVEANEGGYLVIQQPWPGMLRNVWGDPERFKSTYLERFPNKFFTGDGARRDEDGYYWILGRLDDVIKVSGHRIGTMEIESAIVSHPKVAEAAVAPIPHEIKGQAIYAYVTLMEGIKKTTKLKRDIVMHVRTEIGPVFQPEVIQFADTLPKTRSGKIMRRILKAIATGSSVGNITTLADPSVVDELIREKLRMEAEEQ